jgi:hypothetical protein
MLSSQSEQPPPEFTPWVLGRGEFSEVAPLFVTHQLHNVAGLAYRSLVPL